ncbi:hypothetical protein JCM8097_001577 [Rhodosporidiobolus ruineniae]
MANPSSSDYSNYAHPSHHQLAGKGLPAYHPPPQQPYFHHHRPGHPGPPPDLTQRYKLRAKYHKLQQKYTRSLNVRKDLTLELAEKEAKVQQLQDEVDLILDQIHASDYAHLVPALDDLFSDDDHDLAEDDGEGEGDEGMRIKPDPEGEDGAAGARGKGKGRQQKTLDELEDERRRELEAQWGVDGSKAQATLNRLPPVPSPSAFSATALPSVSPAANLASLPALPGGAALPHLQQQQLPPGASAGDGGTKLKLKFGGAGA